MDRVLCLQVFYFPFYFILQNFLFCKAYIFLLEFYMWYNLHELKYVFLHMMIFFTLVNTY